MNKQLDEIYFYWLERTTRKFRQFSQKSLQEHGYNITGDQWVILKRLHESPGSLQKDLASATYKDPASVTRTLDLLEKKGLVMRKADPEDRRGFEVYLTKEGENTVQGILPIAVQMRKKGKKGISKQEMKTFKKVMDQLYKNFS